MKDNQPDLFSETKICYRCKKDLPATEEFFSRNSHNGKRSHLKNFCRECDRKDHRVVASIKKLSTTPPKSTDCDCCGRSLEELSTRNVHLDHCRKTETFRGWLCKSCNIGLGMLGDDVQGLTRALRYLQKHEEQNGCKRTEVC